MLDYHSEQFEAYGKALEKIGINLYDEDNNIKSVYEIMSELSQVWEKLSEDSKDELRDKALDLEKYIDEHK